jgi:hypothetical protein
LLILVGILSYNCYQRGYKEGLKGLEDYNNTNYDYYNEWHLLNATESSSPNHYSEYLSYDYSTYHASKIDDYYSLSFDNYNAEEGFEITLDLNQSYCVIHTMNNTCYRDFNETIENPYPTNCDKDYNIGNKPWWVE